jgi:pilus assembly protein FimV
MATKNANRFRVFMVISSLVLGFGNSAAFAVGMGNITIQSALNQPLNARIELIEVGDLEAQDFQVGLASNAEFARSGIDRTQFMNDMSFSPVIRSGGKSYIQVTSRQPVNEPYLSFLVRLERPTGRQLREFTVLIDPPGYRTPSSASASNRYQLAPESSPVVSRPARTSISAPAPRPDLRVGSATYQTKTSDTLWKIAQALVRQAGKGSIQQVMDDLYALNADAFAGGNIHRLKVGQTLRLPEAFSYPNIPSQNPVSLPAATGGSSEDNASTNVTAPKSSSPAPTAQPEQSTPTATDQNQLLLGMAQLQTQLEQLQLRLDETVKSKDDQIAVLQEEVAQLRATVTQNAASAQALSDKSIVAAPERVETVVSSAVGQPDPAMPEPIRVDPPQPQVTTSDSVSPVSVPIEQDESSLSSYMWLIPIGALLAALLIGIRRRHKANLNEEADAAMIEEPAAVDLEPGEHLFVPLVEPVIAASNAKPAKGEEVEPPTRPVAAVGSDEFLGRAEIYVAYGRYNQAREVLEEGIAEQPERLDLRMMLLQVFAALGERKLFAAQEAAVLELGGNAHAIEQFKALLPAMSEESSERLDNPSYSLADEEIEALELPEDLEEEWKPQLDLKAEQMAPTQANIENFDLDLQDLSFDDAIALTELLDAEQGHEKPKQAIDVEDDFPYTLGELPSVDELDDITLDEHFAGHLPGMPVSHGELDDYPSNPLLEQAKSCMAQGDMRAASAILQRILNEGNDAQRQEAEVLLARIA